MVSLVVSSGGEERGRASGNDLFTYTHVEKVNGERDGIKESTELVRQKDKKWQDDAS